MKKNFTYQIIALIVSFTVFSQGCATILGGSKHTIHVKQGIPRNARVYLNGEYFGEAPENVKVQKSARQGNSYIEIKADGYETSKISLTRKVSVGFTVLDICCLILPLAIDFATGNIYMPRPNRIDYYLETKEGYNLNKAYGFEVGEFVIFSYGKYKNQEGEIVALYPNKALVKFRRSETLIEKMSNKIKVYEEQIEVPFLNIAKK